MSVLSIVLGMLVSMLAGAVIGAFPASGMSREHSTTFRSLCIMAIFSSIALLISLFSKGGA